MLGDIAHLARYILGVQNTCRQLSLMRLTSMKQNEAIILRSRKSFRITCTTGAELCQPALLSHGLPFAARRSQQLDSGVNNIHTPIYPVYRVCRSFSCSMYRKTVPRRAG